MPMHMYMYVCKGMIMTTMSKREMSCVRRSMASTKRMGVYRIEHLEHRTVLCRKYTAATCTMIRET